MERRVYFVVSLFFVSLFSVGALAAQDLCAQLKAPLGPNVEITYVKLVNFIKCNHFTRIDQVLRGLPLRLRSRYVLVYKSHSRHKDATFDEPRIILEDEEAKIIIASAGNPKQINGDNLEVIENGSDGSDSKFHVIVTPEQNGGEIKYSDDNPKMTESCVKCHRQHLSPNWESYPNWPGVYGSGGSGLDEEDHYKAFVDKLKDEKLSDPQSLVLARYTALDGLVEGKVDIYELESRNHTFAQDIGMFNQTRLTKRITSDPSFEKMQPALSAAAQGCANLESFFPATYQSKFPISLAEYQEQVEADTLTHFRGELKTIADLTGDSYVDPVDWLFFFDVKPFIPMGYVMKYAMGIDPDDYSVTKDSSIYNSEHTLGGFTTGFSFYGYGQSCGDLKKLSLQKLGTITGR